MNLQPAISARPLRKCIFITRIPGKMESIDGYLVISAGPADRPGAGSGAAYPLFLHLDGHSAVPLQPVPAAADSCLRQKPPQGCGWRKSKYRPFRPRLA